MPAAAQNPDVGNGAVGGAGEPMVASDAPIVVFSRDRRRPHRRTSTARTGSNIWERNLLTSTTTLVSKSVSGDPNGTSGNHNPVISNFGTSVAWSSNSNDVSSTPFPPAQQNNPLDHLYAQLVLPIQSPTVMVDTDKTGAIACDANSNHIGISGDGLSVAFQSNCDDISATPDTNGSGADVFERTFAPIPGLPKLLSINDTGDGTGNSDSLAVRARRRQLQLAVCRPHQPERRHQLRRHGGHVLHQRLEHRPARASDAAVQRRQRDRRAIRRSSAG